MHVLITLGVVLLTTCSALADFQLLVLHNNDMHSHFEETSATSGSCLVPGKCYGGFARTRKAVSDIREKEKDKRNVIFLNAGDTFQGTPYYTIFKWEVVAPFLDLLGIDVMSLGNHEFDDSPSGLAPYLNATNTVSVVANIDVSEEPSLISPKLQKHHILNVNGTKVAVIGYLTPSTTFLSKPGKVKFFEEIESINKEIEELKKQDINIFIALGHSGYNKDLEIAKHVPDIDLVIGGHTNTFLYTGNPPDLEIPIDTYPKIVVQDSKRKVPVVQAYAYTKYLGYLELDFDDDGEIKSYSGNPILLTNDYPEDEYLLSKLKSWQEKMGYKIHEVVGKTKVFLDAHNSACKLGECNIGNLIVDAMIFSNSENYVGTGWTDAPIAITQAGGIRSSIHATENDGNVTYGDIATVLPYGDELFKMKIKGRHLREAMEFSVHRYQQTDVEDVGEFLQVSGIRVTYDISAEPGKRVKTIRVRCGECVTPDYSDLNDEEEYGLILTHFLLYGGDNYQVLKNSTYDVTSIGTTDTDALISYFRKKSPIYPMITNRITLLNVPSKPSSSVRVTSGPTLLLVSFTFTVIYFIQSV